MPFRNGDLILRNSFISASHFSQCLVLNGEFIFHLNLNRMWNEDYNLAGKAVHREPVTGQGHTFCLTSFFLLFLFPLDNVVVHVIIMNLLAEKIECKHIISVSNKCAFALTNRPSYCTSASPSSCQNGLQFSFLLPNTILPERNITEKTFLYLLYKLLCFYFSVSHWGPPCYSKLLSLCIP